MFQSFLIIGQADSTRKKTLEIFKKNNSDFSKNSPDITIVSPAKMVTTIDQVREIKSKINQKPVALPFKYVIFEEAHTLNAEAQNALLKTLEEPPASAVIILEATDRSFFLPTILSRVTLVHGQESKKNLQAFESFLSLDAEALLSQIGEIDNAREWISTQMVLLYQELQESFKSANIPPSKYQNALENCLEAQKMIDANVNPKFVIANLLLQAQ